MINESKVKSKKLKSVSLQKKRGFTVLESIVAIFVLSLAISGVFSAVQQSLSQAIITKDEVKAFYLAQEAIEIIRNKKDSNQISFINSGSGHWLRGIAENASDPCYFGKVCLADVSSMTLSYCSNSWESCSQNLRKDQTTLLYGQDSLDSLTNFRRLIKIESINSNEISVTVKIIWNKGVLEKQFEAKTYLLNWI